MSGAPATALPFLLTFVLAFVLPMALALVAFTPVVLMLVQVLCPE